MKKLIEALHVIQDECKKHPCGDDCPFYSGKVCMVTDCEPNDWIINDKPQKVLL